jgi:Kef-type K+ transport system membrane component KefB
VLLLVIFAGRFVLRQVLRVAARSHARILTATALLVAFGTAFLQPPACPWRWGLYVGVLLADSEFRHQLKRISSPSGPAAGPVFISVGMSSTSDCSLPMPVCGLLVCGIVA